MLTFKRLSNIMRYGFGSRARARKQADKAKARNNAFASNLWQHADGLARRQYGSYEEYLDHQAAKLDKIATRLEETQAHDLADFVDRFQHCAALNGARSVLCLGARLGTEVKALHALGYFAVGVDLNPGPANPYVLPGDFHHLVFPTESVDAIYTNTLDHVFDLEKFISEIKRLLRPGGLFIADVLDGYEEGFIPGAFESTHWHNAAAFIERLGELGGFTLEGIRDLGYIRRDRWRQAVLRKPIQ